MLFILRWEFVQGWRFGSLLTESLINAKCTNNPETKNEKKVEEEKKIMKTETKFVLGGICAVVVGATAVLSFKSVPANNVGIKYSKINGTSTEVLSEGIHYKVPFKEQIRKTIKEAIAEMEREDNEVK